MITHLDHKVNGGKLLRVELELEKGKVVRVRVRGDFFAHPEESFEAAESELIGIPARHLVEASRTAFSRPGLVMYGVSAADIAAVLGRACDAAQAS